MSHRITTTNVQPELSDQALGLRRDTGDSLFKGVSVEILEERDGWIRVGRDGAEIGWVYERLLDVGDE